jgi:D-lyxose ketol-isomerase
MIQNAWSNVKKVVMIKAWDQLLQDKTNRLSKIVIARSIGLTARDVLKLLRRLPGCQHCTEGNVKHWFQHDNLSTMVMDVYSDIVIRDFQKEILEESKHLIDDEAGPSKKRANIVSGSQ